MKDTNILKTLLVLILVLNIADGSFRNPSVLDIIKLVLLIIAFALLFKRKEK